MKNILILNAGTRNKLVRYFKHELHNNAKVIATDSYYLAPAIYEADKYYVTSNFRAEGYWDNIEKICDDENVGLIVSLIDPELEELALRRERFEKKGILLNSADYSKIHDCFDKMNTIKFLKDNGFPYIKSYTSLSDAEKALASGDVGFPLFMKPRCGSGSAGIQKIENLTQLKNGCAVSEDYMIQEFMPGQELGVDVYVDLISNEVCGVFVKKKLKMRAGETDKSISFKDEKLFDTIVRFAKEYGLRGANDVDVFEKNGEYYISEVNPRFGGGYLHAYECGVNFPKFLINNMCGIQNTPDVGNYKEGVYMMKFFDVKIMREKDDI
ncbi:MAG: ATP-grasp domain-containing protein [Clostridiales bacterium]|nr:ATP-grasp domain-containing protein [Clostridiales bacterium]